MESHNEEEIFEFINETDFLYKISSHGRIFSVKRNMFLKQFITRKGYYAAQIHVNTKIKTFKTHRLVAQAFIPNPYNKPQVNHKNGDKLYNYACNLEWNTAKENMQHAYSTGIKNNRGTNNPFSKLTDETVLAIREYFKICENPSLKEASALFKVTISTISSIKNNKQWTHVTQ